MIERNLAEDVFTVSLATVEALAVVDNEGLSDIEIESLNKALDSLFKKIPESDAEVDDDVEVVPKVDSDNFVLSDLSTTVEVYCSELSEFEVSDKLVVVLLSSVEVASVVTDSERLTDADFSTLLDVLIDSDASILSLILTDSDFSTDCETDELSSVVVDASESAGVSETDVTVSVLLESNVEF